jgi:hypothetical protein
VANLSLHQSLGITYMLLLIIHQNKENTLFSWVDFFFCVCVWGGRLGFELRALYLRGKHLHLTHSTSPFPVLLLILCSFFLETGFCDVAQASLELVNFSLLSTGIIGMYHYAHLAFLPIRVPQCQIVFLPKFFIY